MGGEKIKLVPGAPEPAVYQALREAVGWPRVDDRAVETGLRNSLYSALALDGDEVVGLVRVVGDGGIYFYLQDVIVLPAYRGRGLGRRLVGAAMEYIAGLAGPNSMIALLAAAGAADFYKPFGFVERPAGAPGMWRLWPADGGDEEAG